jgi:hypothetical protein
MPVIIGEITSEVVLEPESAGGETDGGAAPAVDEEALERVVRQAVRRVLAELRLEWER